MGTAPTLLYAGVIASPIRRYPRHQHDHWEVCCYLEGRGQATIGGTPVPFTAGTIIAMPPGLPHQEDATVPFTNVHVGLRGNLSDRILACSDDATGAFRGAALHLAREMTTQPPGWEAAASALTDLLIILLRRSTAPVDALVDRADALLHHHLGDAGFRIARLARDLSVSDDTLGRRFQAHHGETPRRRLMRLRLQAARLRLAEGASVAEAAASAGFPDPFYFSRAFRAAFGHPPSKELAIRGPGMPDPRTRKR